MVALFIANPLQAKEEEREVLCFHVLSCVKWMQALCLVTCTEQTTTQVAAQNPSAQAWALSAHSAAQPESIIRAPFTAARRRQWDLFWGGSALNVFSFHFHSFITGEEERDITLSRGFTSGVLRNIKSYQNTFYESFSFPCRVFFVLLFQYYQVFAKTGILCQIVTVFCRHLTQAA